MSSGASEATTSEARDPAREGSAPSDPTAAPSAFFSFFSFFAEGFFPRRRRAPRLRPERRRAIVGFVVVGFVLESEVGGVHLVGGDALQAERLPLLLDALVLVARALVVHLVVAVEVRLARAADARASVLGVGVGGVVGVRVVAAGARGRAS